MRVIYSKCSSFEAMIAVSLVRNFFLKNLSRLALSLPWVSRRPGLAIFFILTTVKQGAHSSNIPTRWLRPRHRSCTVIFN